VFSGDNPGFDAVIGNPPYLSFSGRQAVELTAVEKTYLTTRYASKGWLTSHGIFMERAVKLLSRRFIGFIVPDQIGHLEGYAHVRETVLQHAGLAAVQYWGEQVFRGAVIPALTVIADKFHKGPTRVCHTDGASGNREFRGNQAWVLKLTREFDELLARLVGESHSLGNLVADPGVHTGNCSKKLVLPRGNGEGKCVPVLEGKHVSRYACRVPDKELRLDYTPSDGEYFTIRPRERYTAARFLIRQTASYPIVGPREHAEYFRNSLLALYDPEDGTDVRYLVGLLNSRLLRHIYQGMVHESQQKTFPQVKVRSLRKLPIRTIDFSDPADRARHDKMVSLVQTMLDLHKHLTAAKTAHEKTTLQRQIAATDHQIDQLVYDLYGLTEEEIRIVEEGISRP